MLRLASDLVTDTKEDFSIPGSKSRSPRRWGGKTIRAGGWTGVLRNAAFWIRRDRHNHEHTAATCKSPNHPANKDMGVRWGVLELCFQVLWLALEERAFWFPWYALERRKSGLQVCFEGKWRKPNRREKEGSERSLLLSPSLRVIFCCVLFCFWVNVEPKMSHELAAILPLRYIPSPRLFYWNNLTN